MAANLSRSALAGTFRKRFAHIWVAAGEAPAASRINILYRRAVHVVSYDKNMEETVLPTIVPDNVIGPRTEKYWGPDPRTGIFGPSDRTTILRAGGDHSIAKTCSVIADGNSVLDQKVRFLDVYMRTDVSVCCYYKNLGFP